MQQFTFYLVLTQLLLLVVFFIPANEPEIFKISPGEKVAIIGTSGDDISVVEMSA